MAQKLFSSTEVTNAQVAYQQGVYTLFQNKTDMWGQIKKLPADMVNATGIQVSFLRYANPSLSYGTGNNDAYATAGAGDYDNFTVGYVNINAGNIQTVAGVLNSNKNTVENMLDFELQESAKQFASFLNSYVSRGDGTMALATISANYSGGTPTIATCNGTTDSIGTTQLAVGGYYLFYDATGATQRTGTVGASAIQLSSKTGTACTFASNIPSDVVDTDIIVPQIGGATDASVGLYGLPIIDDSAGTYFGKARATYGGLASYEKTSAGTLTAGMLNETYWSIVQRGGYFTGAGASNLDDKLWTVMSTGNAQNYQSLSLNSGALVSSPQTFMHTGERPQNDIGFSTHDMTWYGSPLWIANSVRGDEIYFLGKDSLRRAILKDVGDVDGRFPAGNYLQNINGDGAYLQARVKMMDFFGQVYAPEPFKIGKISGLTLVAPSQKSVMVVS
jgi:hypothetical protein